MSHKRAQQRKHLARRIPHACAHFRRHDLPYLRHQHALDPIYGVLPRGRVDGRYVRRPEAVQFEERQVDSIVMVQHGEVYQYPAAGVRTRSTSAADAEVLSADAGAG
ncbi:hypothetical protein ABW21_db0200023 [Orbilia brochopaga]|nr:hypothetical protein ABW21_db0200023 [Drechslerella brochopaga]